MALAMGNNDAKCDNDLQTARINASSTLAVWKGAHPWGVDAGWEAVVWGLVLLGGVVTNSGPASINPQLLPSHIPVVLHCFVLIHFFILVLGNVPGFILLRWS